MKQRGDQESIQNSSGKFMGRKLLEEKRRV